MPHSTVEAGERNLADPVEGRGHRVEDLSRDPPAGTPSRETVGDRLRRIATLVEKAAGRPFTTLAHHVDLAWLREAYARTRKDGAPGVDGLDGDDYSKDLEGNLQDLLRRIRTNTYRAPPVRGVDIPKGDGKSTRPLGIPTFEDKIFQRAVVMLLEPLYEPEFHPGSYGFRPGRSAHHALSEVQDHLQRAHGGWVLEVDIRKFFDTLDHDQLMALLQQKVRDGTVLTWIRNWLKAGVQKDGALTHRAAGTPQGGVISPLLANVYLHHVLDQWFEGEVRPRLQGSSRLIRYADDFVILFEHEEDARRVLAVLPKRFGKYGLALHPEKTRLVPFHQPRPPGWRGRRDPNRPEPESFDLLGFTHVWARTLRGTWVVRQKTAQSRLTRALKAIRLWCKLHRHDPIRVQHAKLSAKVRGHFQYYGNPGNWDALWRFSREVFRAWFKWLARRSQKLCLKRLIRVLAAHPLPTPKTSPWPKPTAANP
jgi:RNA-directed DNA polymerase